MCAVISLPSAGGEVPQFEPMPALTLQQRLVRFLGRLFGRRRRVRRTMFLLR
jgi:hypothetical protein